MRKRVRMRMILRRGCGGFLLGLVELAGQKWLRMAMKREDNFFPMATYQIHTKSKLKIKEGICESSYCNCMADG